MGNGNGALDIINAMVLEPGIAGYVIDADTNRVVAHTTLPEYVGLDIAPVLGNGFLSLDVFKQIVAEYDGAWLRYPFPDQSGNIIVHERGWFKQYDNYIFGSHYTVTDDVRVQSVIDEMIRLYQLNSDGAFDIINSFMSYDLHHPFVIDLDTLASVAKGSDPSFVGDPEVAAVLLYESAVTLEEFRSLDEDEGIWAEYSFVDPVTHEVSTKISWLVMYDGYLFCSGYYS